MKPTRTAGIVTAAALALMLAVPAAAAAAPVTSHVVGKVSGVEIARALISDVRGVDLGSHGVTITVDVAGHPHEVRVGLDGVTGSTGRPGDGQAWLVLAAVPMVGGSVIRFLAALARLGGS